MSMIQIQRGDTLGKLVAKYNREHGTKLTVAQVAQANGLRDANKIQAGRQLIFPDQFEQQAPQQVIRNGQGDKMVRNGVKETTTVDSSPRMELPVQDALNAYIEGPGKGDWSIAKKVEQELGKVSGTTDEQLLASAGPTLRPFYDALRAKEPKLADSLLQTMRETAAYNRKQPELLTTESSALMTQLQLRPLLPLPEAPKTVDAQSQEQLRQQRLRILA